MPSRSSTRDLRVDDYLRNPQTHLDWTIKAGEYCKKAPFTFPTDGYVGYLWDDSFRIGHRHQGIDIFGTQPSGKTPIYAAYSGYLTRLIEWKSSLIIRIPHDPLINSRQIWTYYTHMADSSGTASYVLPDFPAGTNEVFVTQGTLLGYQGNYSGTPDNPVGIHLHFSVVRDDGTGKYLNELKIENTLDPSPYFGLSLNAGMNKGDIPLCKPSS
ncbi:MAG: M23 family metallopeptidase [Chloroflexota bacterium]